MPDDASVVVVAGPKTDFFPPEIDALKKYLDKAGKLLLSSIRRTRPDSPPLTNLIALAHDWGIDVGNDVVVDVSGMGRLIGTDASVPVAASYPVAPDHRALQLPDGVSAGAIGRRRSAAASTATSRSRSSRRARAAGPRPTSRAC